MFIVSGNNNEHGSDSAAIPQLWMHGYISSAKHSQSLRRKAE